MTETLTHSERLHKQLEQMMAPLKAQYEEVGKEINDLNDEVVKIREQQAALKRTREEIRRLIRVTDSDFATRPYAKNGNKKNGETTVHKYSAEKMEQLRVWLHANAEQLNKMNGGRGFYATETVTLFSDIPVSGQSGFSAIIKQAHDAGLVRLSRKGGAGGVGGRKFYKVVI